jgi:hypothetical protein
MIHRVPATLKLEHGFLNNKWPLFELILLCIKNFGNIVQKGLDKCANFGDLQNSFQRDMT